MLVCVNVFHYVMVAVAWLRVHRWWRGAVGRHWWGRGVVDRRGRGWVCDGHGGAVSFALVRVTNGHGSDGTSDSNHLDGLHVRNVVMAVAAALVAFVAFVTLAREEEKERGV